MLGEVNLRAAGNGGGSMMPLTERGSRSAGAMAPGVGCAGVKSSAGSPGLPTGGLPRSGGGFFAKANEPTTTKHNETARVRTRKVSPLYPGNVELRQNIGRDDGRLVTICAKVIHCVLVVRYATGVVPVSRLKARKNVVRVPNPHW